MLMVRSLVVVCLAYGNLWAATPQSTPFDETSRRAVQAAAEAAAARDTARSADSKAGVAADTARSADSKAAAANDTARSADSKASAATDAARAADSKAGAATDTAKAADSKAGVATDAAKAATKKADTAVVQAASADEVAKKASEDAASAKKSAEAANARANEAVTKAEAAVPEAREEARRIASSVTIPSNRSSHVVGAYFSLWGDPYPTTTGINLGYNVYDFLRVNAGFGSDDPDVFRLNTAGVGAKMYMPGWNFSPTVGLNVSFVKNEGDKRPRSVRGFSPNGAIPYANFGFDWQTGLGFNFAVGYDLPLKVGYAGSWYFNAGIFL